MTKVQRSIGVCMLGAGGKAYDWRNGMYEQAWQGAKRQPVLTITAETVVFHVLLMLFRDLISPQLVKSVKRKQALHLLEGQRLELLHMLRQDVLDIRHCSKGKGH
eukprot:1147134-Pelagomonas_calceolata.AAC.1